MEQSSRIFADAGWSVLFLGVGALGADSLSFAPHANRRVRKLRFVKGGIAQKWLYFRFLVWILFWTLRWRPAVVYASDPLSTPVGWLLSFFPGIHIIYHEHDSPPLHSSAGSRMMRIVMVTRRWLAARTLLNVLPNQRRVECFKLTTGTARPVRCVWNCPAKQDAEVEPKKAAGFRLYFHGSIVPARMPLSIVDALARLPERDE